MLKIPDSEHYAIITEQSVYIPGDERSRTNPGHGYPASTEYYTVYKVYTDKVDWENDIRRFTLEKREFRAIVATPVTVTVKVEVKTQVIESKSRIGYD